MKRTVVILVHIIFVLSLVLLNSCKNSGKNTVEIRGKIFNSRNQMIYLNRIDVFDKLIIDSTKLDKNGEFNFKVKIPEAGFYSIGSTTENFVLLLVEEGEKINISGNIDDLANTAIIEGSVGSLLIKQIQEHTMQNNKRLDSLALVWEREKYNDAETKMRVRKQLEESSDSIFKNQRVFLEQFLKSKQGSLSCILVLYQVFRERQMFDSITDFSVFEQVEAALNKKYKNNSHVRNLNARIEKARFQILEKKKIEERLSKGSIMPEISLPGKDGIPISLTSLRGNPVLLFFWSSDCVNCRKFMKDINGYSRKYREKKLRIYAICLDLDLSIFEKTQQAEKFEAVHVCDMKGWSSPIVKICNVDKLPYFFFLNADGIIVEKSANFEELNQVLSKYFSS